MKAVNLLPTQRRTTVSLSSLRNIRPGYVVAVVLAALAVMAVMYGTARNQAATYESEAAAVRTQVATVKRSIAAVAAAAAAIPASEQLVGNAAKVAEARFAWAPLFHQLATHLPAKVMFTALSVTLITPDASTASSLKAPEAGVPVGATVVLTGCASAQRPVASLMRALRGVTGVSEVALQSSAEQVAGSSSSASGASGGCPKAGPVFSMTVNMVPATPRAVHVPTRAVLAFSIRRTARGKK